jgi:hypothetical protein
MVYLEYFTLFKLAIDLRDLQGTETSPKFIKGMTISLFLLWLANVIYRCVTVHTEQIESATVMNCVAEILLLGFMMAILILFLSVRQSSIPNFIRIPNWIATFTALLYLVFSLGLLVLDLRATASNWPVFASNNNWIWFFERKKTIIYSSLASSGLAFIFLFFYGLRITDEAIVKKLQESMRSSIRESSRDGIDDET